MAIAFDAVTNSTSASFSHTCTGFARGLLVWVESPADDITATYGGVAMTKLGSVQLVVAGDWATLLSLVNPSAGSNTVAISGTTPTNGNNAVSYTGVLGFANYTSGQNVGASIALVVTVSVANSWVTTGAFGRLGPHNLTPSTGVTNDRTAGNTALGVGDSGPEGAGTVSHTWNNASGLNSSALGCEVQLTTAVPSSGGTMAMMGV